MAADLVENPRIEHTFVHDLESTFYVVFWLSIRLLPNSWSPLKRALVMQEVFNPVAFSDGGSSSKKNWMANAPDEDRFSVDDNEPLSSLIDALLHLFFIRHFFPGNNDSSIVNARAILGAGYTQADLADHTKIISLFRESLEKTWPKGGDPATTQDIENLGHRCSSKRSKLCYGEDTEESSNKWHRYLW
jgi:hypothetical protein